MSGYEVIVIKPKRVNNRESDGELGLGTACLTRSDEQRLDRYGVRMGREEA